MSNILYYKILLRKYKKDTCRVFGKILAQLLKLEEHKDLANDSDGIMLKNQGIGKIEDQYQGL